MKTSFYEFNLNCEIESDSPEVFSESMVIEALAYEQAEQIVLGLAKSHDFESDIDWYTLEHIDLEEINLKGWEASVAERLNMPLSESELEWKYKFKKYEVVEQPKWTKHSFNIFTGKIKFQNIEEYVELINAEYGGANFLYRILYLDGKVQEFNF